MYAASKLFKQIFVPDTQRIPIIDARDPDDVMMLCETINLYRLKEMLTQEEELFFLLIDIMRSPVVFKDLCKDSIKNDQPPKPKIVRNKKKGQNTQMQK